MRVTRKILTQAAANLFFKSIFQRYSLFFFGFFSFFLYYSLFVFFAFFFLKFKIYILIHIRLCGRVGDKKLSPDRFPETRLLFFGLIEGRIAEQPPEVFCKKMCSQKFCKIHRKTPVPKSFFLKSCSPQACNFLKKETLAQVFSSESCEIYKNTFFIEHLRVTTSGIDTSRFETMQIYHTNDMDQMILKKSIYTKNPMKCLIYFFLKKVKQQQSFHQVWISFNFIFIS